MQSCLYLLENTEKLKPKYTVRYKRGKSKAKKIPVDLKIAYLTRRKFIIFRERDGGGGVFVPDF